jgi:tellurite resistance protein
MPVAPNNLRKLKMTNTHSRIEHFPLPLFSSVMGIGGYALATRAAGLSKLTIAMTVLATVIGLLVATLYGLKAMKYPKAVQADFGHPIRHAFFPAISIGLLIMAEVYFPLSEAVSFALWIIGAVLQLWFTLHILTTWMYHDKFEITMITPAWFIPVVGNVLVPIAGIHHAPVELLWFFLSYGMFFWLVLQTIMMYRVIFHTTIPPKLMPTFFIMIAPPAVSFTSYVQMTQGMEHGLDHFALFLYFIAAFITLMLLYRAKKFISLPFALTWWSYTFPMTAVTTASFMMAHAFTDSSLHTLYNSIAWGLFGLTSVIVFVVMVQTTRAMLAGKVCVPD